MASVLLFRADTPAAPRARRPRRPTGGEEPTGAHVEVRFEVATAVPGVLIVDDDPDILEGIQGFLQSSLGPVAVHVAQNSDEALAVLRGNPIGVVVSDYRMPGEDGVALLAKVRASYPGVRGVLWTAFPDRGLAERAFAESGAVCFVTKLAPPATLLGLVEDLIAKRPPRGDAGHDVIINPDRSG